MQESLYHILSGLMKSQVYVDQYTKRLAARYNADEILRKFTIPRAVIDSIDLELKFAIVITPIKGEDQISDETRGQIIEMLSERLNDYFKNDPTFSKINSQTSSSFRTTLLNELFAKEKKFLKKSEDFNIDLKDVLPNVLAMTREILQGMHTEYKANDVINFVFSEQAVGKSIRSTIYNIVEDVVGEVLKVSESSCINLQFETSKISQLDCNIINTVKYRVQMDGKTITPLDEENQKVALI